MQPSSKLLALDSRGLVMYPYKMQLICTGNPLASWYIMQTSTICMQLVEIKHGGLLSSGSAHAVKSVSGTAYLILSIAEHWPWQAV